MFLNPSAFSFTCSFFGISLQLENMSPAIASSAGAASKDVKKESATARLLGSGKSDVPKTPNSLLTCGLF